MNKHVSSREFNQDRSGIKKATESGPVFITDRGRPSHVLMTIEHYERLVGPKRPWGHELGDADAAEIEFDLEPNRDASFRSVELD